MSCVIATKCKGVNKLTINLRQKWYWHIKTTNHKQTKCKKKLTNKKKPFGMANKDNKKVNQVIAWNV